jgi:hypothetical protein
MIDPNFDPLEQLQQCRHDLDCLLANQREIIAALNSQNDSINNIARRQQTNESMNLRTHNRLLVLDQILQQQLK